jgi:hypothetical protein
VAVYDKLGNPECRVVVTQRGGTGQRIEFPYESLTYERSLNTFSTASVNLPSTGEARTRCCDLLNGLATRYGDTDVPPIDVWSHDLTLYTDGHLEWAGPITGIQFNQRQVQLTARDVFQVFERRYLHLHDRQLAGDLADNFTVLVADALEEDDSPNIQVTAKPTGIHQEMTVKAINWARASDLMRTLFSAGLDFCAVARDIYVGGVEILFPDVMPVWDPMADVTSLDRRGIELATRYGFTGELREKRVQVEVGGIDSRYGLLELHETDLDVKDHETALAAATSRWDFVKTPPNYVTATLTDEGPHVRHLIPGMHCDVRLSGRKLGCRDIRETMRLAKVRVQAGAGRVTVSLDLTPLGRVTE